MKQAVKGQEINVKLYFKSFKMFLSMTVNFCWRGYHKNYKTVLYGIIVGYCIKGFKITGHVSEDNKTNTFIFSFFSFSFFPDKKISKYKTVASFQQSTSICTCCLAGGAAALPGWEMWKRDSK